MITILLLSHNNPAHLKRALEYYKRVEFKGRIIIADSSRDESRKTVRSVVEDVQERLFAPTLLEYETTLYLSEKIALASQHVATPYALLAGVDDFFSPQFMYEAMWFLKNNPEHGFVYGKMYGFTYDTGEPKFYYTGYFDKLRSFEAESPIQRLVEFFPRYSACFNSVIRTEILQNISGKTVKFLKKLVTSENLYMMLLLLECKTKFIPKPFHWRELSDESDGSTLAQRWLKDDEFRSDFAIMKECLSETFEEKKLCDDSEVKQKAHSLIEEFFCLRYAMTFPSESARNKKFKNYMPAILISKIRRLKTYAKNAFINDGSNYIRDQRSAYAKEFEVVKKIITQSDIQAFRTGLEQTKQVRGF